jgi:enoyl-CoA hydratase/carnithine racemase
MTTNEPSEVVLHEIRDSVALLTLNRPNRLNAWTPAMEKRYFGLLEAANDDSAVRVIVVTGAGRGFCSGVDMEALQAIGGGGTFEHSGKAQTFPLTIEKPILAAVNGACAGLGLVQALMCDLRFAAAGAKFTTAFVRRGLVAEHGISWLLPRLVGHAHALDLLLSGRVILAEEAAAIGLVNRVVEPAELVETTFAYARDLAANCSPMAMSAIKRQVYRHYELGLVPALAETNELMAKSLEAADFREGVASFLEKRPPRFAPIGNH